MNAFRFLAAVSVIFSHLSYTLTPDFDNPIAEQRADHRMYKTDNGTCYLIATVPE